jgi:hypothetical protein
MPFGDHENGNVPVRHAIRDGSKEAKYFSALYSYEGDL